MTLDCKPKTNGSSFRSKLHHAPIKISKNTSGDSDSVGQCDGRRMASSRRRRVIGARTQRVGTLAAVEAGADDVHFGFHCVYHVCIYAFSLFSLHFLHSGTNDLETRPAILLKLSPSGLATTFQLSEGVTALPHSSTFLERASSA